MYRTSSTKRFVRVALVSALATTALSGCATKAPRADIAASKAQSELKKGKVSKAIASAEQAVAADPRNPNYRAVLASAYMEAGRFQSAATTFDDAMKLGDHSPRTALSLALAKIASGDMTGAQAILYDWKDELEVSDLGLATTLAGAPQRGVQILSDALRSGNSTPKIRQNLAYSYAMMGDWRSARLMAAEDLPAGQIGDRMSEWAARSGPQQHQERVAALIGAPIVNDSGQPQQLALANSPDAEQLAAEASGLVPVAQAERAANNGALEELPPIGDYINPPEELLRVAAKPQPRSVSGANDSAARTQNVAAANGADSPQVAASAAAEPEVDVTHYQAPAVRPQNFEQAFAAPAPRGGSVADVASQTMDLVTRPVVQKMPVRYGVTGAENRPEKPAAQRSARRSSAGAEATITASEAGRIAAVSGERLVQLGSFASEQGARRAWGIFAARWPSLTNYEMVITKARVHGRLFHRVSAGGFKGGKAQSLCNTVKSQGYDCFAWAEGRPLPGAISGTRMARR